MAAKAPDGPGPVARLQDLVAGYQAQLEQYRRWLALAQQARARVDDEDLDEFLRLHGEKEEVARQLQAQEEQLRAQREALRVDLRLEQFTLSELERACTRVDDPDAFATVLAHFRDLLAHLRAVMQELEPVERETENRLRQRLRALRAQLKDVDSAKRAARAYAQPRPNDTEARFIDQKG